MNSVRSSPVVSANFIRELLRHYPQIGTGLEVDPLRTESVLSFQDVRETWDRLYFADHEIFEVFTHDIVYGDVATAFDDPYSIALSRSTAEYYFGNNNPLGRIINRGELALRVTLVFEEFPQNTHLQYDVLLPMALRGILDAEMADRNVVDLTGGDSYQYLLLRPEFDSELLPGLIDRTVDEIRSLDGSIPAFFGVEIGTTPLTRVHLFTDFITDDLAKSSISQLLGLVSIALMLLLVAVINFINLAIARALKRASSISVQKLLGAQKMHLVSLTLFEAVISAVPAIIIALGMIEMLNVLTPELLRTVVENSNWRANPGLLLGLAIASLLINSDTRSRPDLSFR
ncbi:MAG: FtsX-like permease family protein [Pseudohongiellaceae bacterium]